MNKLATGESSNFLKLCNMPCFSSSPIIDTINSVLSYLGFHLVSDVEDSSKPVSSNIIEINLITMPVCSTSSLALSLSPLSKSLER